MKIRLTTATYKTNVLPRELANINVKMCRGVVSILNTEIK